MNKVVAVDMEEVQQRKLLMVPPEEEEFEGVASYLDVNEVE